MNYSEVEQAIRVLDQEFMKLISVPDYEGLAHGFYTDDAYIVTRGRPLIKGRDAINRFWRDFISSEDVLGLTLTPGHIEAAGPLAFSVGTYTLRTTNSLESGKYLMVYRQGENGAWARAAESFGSDE